MPFPDTFESELQSLGQMAFDLSRVDQFREFLQDAMMRIHIHLVIRFRAKQTPDECERFGHELGSIHFRLALHNRTNLTEWSTNLGTCIHVLVRGMCDENVPG